MNTMSRMIQPWLTKTPKGWLADGEEMKAIKLTTAPAGFEYYRVCSRDGICRVVRGAEAAQNFTEELPSLSKTKTWLTPAEWD